MNQFGREAEVSKVSSTLPRMGISLLIALNANMAWDPTESGEFMALFKKQIQGKKINRTFDYHKRV